LPMSWRIRDSLMEKYYSGVVRDMSQREIRVHYSISV
jgi:hypothetical protein